MRIDHLRENTTQAHMYIQVYTYYVTQDAGPHEKCKTDVFLALHTMPVSTLHTVQCTILYYNSTQDMLKISCNLSTFKRVQGRPCVGVWLLGERAAVWMGPSAGVRASHHISIKAISTHTEHPLLDRPPIKW